jgi:site-specific DNA recombinase
MMRAAVYARKSSDNEAGVERQVEIARDFIAKQEWLPGPVFSDNAISGATFDRPGLSALLAAVAAKPRPFDVLVMMNVDRLSRGTIAETLELQQRILKTGVEIWFYQTGQRVTLTTATDELKGAIDAYGARDFRDQIKAKTKAALRKKAEQGHATGARTFGYALVRKDGHAEREVVPEQAAMVVRIFEMAAEGQGDRRIANLLNAEHAPAPGPKGWSKDGIRRALDNELYIGVACYGKRGAPESEWIRAELPELRVVSDDLWRRVHSRKATTKRHYLRNEAGHLLSKPEAGLVSRYALSGIARCHLCGGGLKAFHGAKDIPRYRCAERLRRGTVVCANNRGIPTKLLDELVVSSLRELLSYKPETVAALLDEREEQRRIEYEAQQASRPNAEAEIQRLEKEIARLVAALAAGTASADVTLAINERRSRVKALRAIPAPQPLDRERLLEGLAGLVKLLDETSPAQVRATLRKLGVGRIEVRPSGEGWDFTGVADLGRAITTGAPEEREG